MRNFILIAASVSVLALGGCSKGDDKLAGRVENAADARADALENQADALDDRAEQVRETGEQRSDAIDAADLNTQAMSAEQKNAILANEAAAVR